MYASPSWKVTMRCHSVRSTLSPEFFSTVSNAGGSAEEGDLQDAVITHSFHPLRGRTVRIYDRVGGSKRAIVRYFADSPAGATLVSVPVSWTSLGQVDDFERVASGRCLFRGDDLIVLRELVDSLLAPAVERDQK